VNNVNQCTHDLFVYFCGQGF